MNSAQLAALVCVSTVLYLAAWTIPILYNGTPVQGYTTGITGFESVQWADARAATDLISGWVGLEGSVWVVATGFLVAFQALLIKWLVEATVNTVPGCERNASPDVSKLRIFLKRAIDDPLYTLTRSPLAFIFAAAKVVGGGIQIAEGIQAGNVSQLKTMAREARQQHIVAGWRLRWWHIVGAGGLVFVTFVADIAAALAYRLSVKNVGGVSGLRTVATVRTSGIGTSGPAGSRGAQDVVFPAKGLGVVRGLASVYRIHEGGYFSIAGNVTEPRKDLGVHVSTIDARGVGTSLSLVTTHGGLTIEHAMFINPLNRKARSDPRVEFRLDNGVESLSVDYSVCGADEEFPTPAGATEGQAVSKCAIEAGESLFQKVLANLEVSFEEDQNSADLEAVQVIVNTSVLISAALGAIVLSLTILVIETSGGRGSRAVSKLTDTLVVGASEDCVTVWRSEGQNSAKLSRKVVALGMSREEAELRNERMFPGGPKMDVLTWLMGREANPARASAMATLEADDMRDLFSKLAHDGQVTAGGIDGLGWMQHPVYHNIDKEAVEWKKVTTKVVEHIRNHLRNSGERRNEVHSRIIERMGVSPHLEVSAGPGSVEPKWATGLRCRGRPTTRAM